MTYEDNDQPIGCGCEDHNPTPDAGTALASGQRSDFTPAPDSAPASQPRSDLVPDLASISASASRPRLDLASDLPSISASASRPRLDLAPDLPSISAPASRRHFLRTAAGLAVAAPSLLAAACGSSNSSPSAGAKQTTGPGTQPTTGGASTSGTPSQASTSPSSSTGGANLPGPETADAALLASRYSGLKPFAPAPPPPATKPVNTNVDLPPVISRVPTDQKICFLTIDDGAEKDPAFLQMVKDFRIPITMFLADCFIQDDYSYFTQLRDTGYCTIQNHTLHHPDMTTLSAQRQLEEVTGQQQKLVKNYNTHPYLFRAPFGNSNKATQQACKQNGLKAICYWRATFQKQGFQWQAADKKLRPGDVLLAHFRGPKANGKGWPEMHELMTNLFRIVQDQGYTFARLEDYV